MKKIVLTFGLIAGAILSATLLLALPFKDAIGFDRGEILGYASMVLAFLLIFFGCVNTGTTSPVARYASAERSRSAR